MLILVQRHYGLYGAEDMSWIPSFSLVSAQDGSYPFVDAGARGCRLAALGCSLQEALIIQLVAGTLSGLVMSSMTILRKCSVLLLLCCFRHTS